MKKNLLLLLLISLFAVSASAAEKEWKYVDGSTLRIINKGWKDTNKPYTRLKVGMKDKVNANLWKLAQESSGVAIRFATNSKNIGIKYTLTYNSHMNHMADTGVKGADLYIYDNGKWRHVNTVRPTIKDSKTKVIEDTFVENLDGANHEYMVYLPLYDGVEKLQIKVDKNATITTGSENLISNKKRIVFYGSSITQGGSASRPGMAYTNIISRELNTEVINLGLSGQAKLDKAMAEALTTIPDVDVFVIDPVPNCTENEIKTSTYDFVKTIRKACPNAKILMVEGPMYPYANYNSYFKNYLPKKNAAYRAVFDKLKGESTSNLYYLTNKNLDGVENNGTVDGIHLTDLGMQHYAEKVVPVLQTIRK